MADEVKSNNLDVTQTGFKLIAKTGAKLENDTGTNTLQNSLEDSSAKKAVEEFNKLTSSAKPIKEEIDKLIEAISNQNIEGIQQFLTELQQNATTLQSTIESGSVGDNSTISSLTSQLSEIQKASTQIQSEINGIQEKYQTAFNNVGEAFAKQIGDAMTGVSQTIEQTSSKVKEFAGALNEISVKTGDMQQEAQKTIDASKQVQQAISEAYKAQEEAIKKGNVLASKTEETQEVIDAEIEQIIQDINNQTGAFKQIGDEIKQMSETLAGEVSAELEKNLEQLQLGVTDAQKNGEDVSADIIVNQLLENFTSKLQMVNDIKAKDDGSNVEVIRSLRDFTNQIQESFSNSIRQKIDVIQEYAKSANVDNKELESGILSLNGLLTEIEERTQSTLTTNENAFKTALINAVNNYSQQQKEAATPGTKSYNRASELLANKSLSAINYDDIANGANDALINLEYSRGKNNPWYQYVTTGNLLGNKTDLANNLRNVQRHGVIAQSVIPNAIETLSKSGLSNKEKAENIGKLAGANLSVSDSIKQTAKGMNLSSGGGKNLTEEDKKVFEAFQKQLNSALDNLTRTINAIEDLDPENKTLGKLKEEQKALLDLKNQADKAKDSSSALSNAFSTIWKGLGKLKNLLAGGLGMMGLGALLSPMQMINKAIGFEVEEGKRRYGTAITDYSMGASLNRGRIYDIARVKPYEYFRLSQGMIKDEEYLNSYRTMAQGVGGHYGSNPEAAANDMQRITENTFAFGRVNGLSDSSIAGFMKATYKDTRMSADEASAALVEVAQAAQSAGVPVEKYVNTITSLSQQLINQGVGFEQVKTSMNGLVTKRGLRVEDASSLLQSQARANENMARDLNGSAFWGMMAGQGHDPMSLIASGYDAYDAKTGQPKDGYFQMMAQRVMSEAGTMGMIGGNAMGGVMFMESLMQRGYTRKDASMIEDAREKGDVGLVAELLKKAEEHKDGGINSLASAIDDAKAKLQEAGNQVSIFQKLQVDLESAQKKIGQAISDYLSGPLALFRQGFEKVLDTIVKYSGKLIDAISEFIGGMTGKGDSSLAKAGAFVANNAEYVWNNPGHALAYTAAGVAGLGGLYLAGRKGLGAASAKLFKNSGPKGTSNIGKTITSLGSKGRTGAVLAGVGVAALAGGFALSTLVSMFTDGSATIRANNSEAEEDKTAGMAEANMLAQPPSNPGLSESNSPASSGESAVEQSTSTESNTEEVPNENGATYGEGYTEEYSQIDSNLEDKKGEYNESLSNAEFLNESVKEMYGDAIENQPLYDDSKYQEQQKNEESNNVSNDILAASVVGTSALGYAGYKYKNRNAQPGAKSYFKNLKDDFKNASKFGKVGRILGGVGSLAYFGVQGYQEFFGENANKYTGAQHIGRFGIDLATGLAGASLGAKAGGAIGAAFGGIGAVPGALLGGVVGGLAGGVASDVIKNSSLGKKFGLADVDDVREAHDKYQSRVKQSESIYGDATKSIVSSNDARTKAAEQALNLHGMKLEDLTNDQEQYMNDVYADLKAHGLEESVAAFIAALSTAGVATQQNNDGKFALENDKDVTAKAMDKLFRTESNSALGSEYPDTNDFFHGNDTDNHKGDHNNLFALDVGRKWLPSESMSYDDKMALGNEIATAANYAASNQDSDTSGLFKRIFPDAGIGTASSIGRAIEKSWNDIDKDETSVTNWLQDKAGKIAYFAKEDNKDDLTKIAGKIAEEKVNGETATSHPEQVASQYQLGPTVSQQQENAKLQQQSTPQAASAQEKMTPESVAKKNMENYKNMEEQISGLAGMKDRALWADNIATGQFIFDGTTTLGMNGKHLSLKGARDLFRMNSGRRTKDMYSSTLQGYADGEGNHLEGAGVKDIRKNMEKKYLKPARTVFADGEHFKGTADVTNALETMHQQQKKYQEQQESTYAQNKENQEKAKQEQDEKNNNNAESASIQIVVMGSGGDKQTAKTAQEIAQSAQRANQEADRLREEYKAKFESENMTNT